MPFRRLIPALSAIGVVAGLAAARMVVEVVPFGRAAEAFIAWVDDVPASSRPPGVAAMPKRAMSAPKKVLSMTVLETSETAPAIEAPADDVDPKTPPTSPMVPTITNSVSPEMPAASWVGA